MRPINILPEAYREALSYYQDVDLVVHKINEIIKGYNGIPKHVADAIQEAINNLPEPPRTDDHRELTNRDAADQHPQSAITGLVAALAAKYALPIGGIPSSDMATAVQTSLGKADTALQSVPDLSSTYVTVAQGAANSGKFLVVNSSGNVALVTLTEWQGGSY